MNDKLKKWLEELSLIVAVYEDYTDGGSLKELRGSLCDFVKDSRYGDTILYEIVDAYNGQNNSAKGE